MNMVLEFPGCFWSETISCLYVTETVFFLLHELISINIYILTVTQVSQLRVCYVIVFTQMCMWVLTVSFH